MAAHQLQLLLQLWVIQRLCVIGAALQAAGAAEAGGGQSAGLCSLCERPGGTAGGAYLPSAAVPACLRECCCLTGTAWLLPAPPLALAAPPHGPIQPSVRPASGWAPSEAACCARALHPRGPLSSPGCKPPPPPCMTAWAAGQKARTLSRCCSLAASHSKQAVRRHRLGILCRLAGQGRCACRSWPPRRSVHVPQRTHPCFPAAPRHTIHIIKHPPPSPGCTAAAPSRSARGRRAGTRAGSRPAGAPGSRAPPPRRCWPPPG